MLRYINEMNASLNDEIGAMMVDIALIILYPSWTHPQSPIAVVLTSSRVARVSPASPVGPFLRGQCDQAEVV